MHTAVALELLAGQARAAELTQTQGGPTTASPQPAEWAVRANPASNLKSPSVAFGIRRHPPGAIRGGLAADCGLDWNAQSPGYWRPAAGRPKTLTYAPATPRARGPPSPADSPRTRPETRAGPAGQPTARAMARAHRAGHRGPQCAGAETDLGRPSWTQSLAGHHWPQSARHMGPTRHSTRRTCRLLRATDSDGTCRQPASTHRGSARPDKAVTSDKMFPATTLPGGPAQHPNAKTLARPGHQT